MFTDADTGSALSAPTSTGHKLPRFHFQVSTNEVLSICLVQGRSKSIKASKPILFRLVDEQRQLSIHNKYRLISILITIEIQFNDLRTS